MHIVIITASDSDRTFSRPASLFLAKASFTGMVSNLFSSAVEHFTHGFVAIHCISRSGVRGIKYPQRVWLFSGHKALINIPLLVGDVI